MSASIGSCESAVADLQASNAAALSAPSRPVGRSKLGQLEEGDAEAPLRVGASPPSEEEVTRRLEAQARVRLRVRLRLGSGSASVRVRVRVRVS